MSGPHGAVMVGGVPFEVSRLEDASAWLIDTALRSNRTGVAVRLANAYCVALGATTPSYGELLRSRGVNFPDGLPVVASMRALTRSTVPRRVRGPSFFRSVLRDGVPHGIRHFFLGSTDETLDRLVGAVSQAHPGIRIAGTYSPPFGPLDDAYLADLVDRAKLWDADVVWVGLGTPKQDFVVQALAERADVVAAGVGAAFDFVAGTVQEAPRWVQRSGFEWAYRLVREPRRLWQRYVFGNARFINIVARQLLSVAADPMRPSNRSVQVADPANS